MDSQALRQIDIPEQKVFDGKPFPMTYTPTEASAGWSEDQWFQWFNGQKDWLVSQVHTYGAVLFRGFPFRTPKDFDTVVKAFGWKPFPYIGGAAPRFNVYGDVFTTNESPPDQLIPFHHEMAQVAKFPQEIFFFCEVQPKEGGETPIVLSNIIYEEMKRDRPEFVARLEAEGVKYTRVMPDGDDPSSAIGRGWQSTFNTQDKAEAEKKVTDAGGSFEWTPEGNFRVTSKVLPPIRKAPTTGQTVWFNQLVAAYTGWKDSRNDPKKAVVFPDGTPLDDEAMQHCVQLKEKHGVAFQWLQGDTIAIDNWTVMHARKTFVPPRRILAALGE